MRVSTQKRITAYRRRAKRRIAPGGGVRGRLSRVVRRVRAHARRVALLQPREQQRSRRATALRAAAVP
jgi:hypothetical protein